MNARLHAVFMVIGGAAVLVAARPAGASDWIEVKTPEELRVLHSNKTFRAKTYAGESSVTHYRADGKGLRIVGSTRQVREWRVEGDNRVCYAGEGMPQQCYRVQRNSKNPSEILLQNVPDAGGAGFAPSVFATVEDGIPQF